MNLRRCCLAAASALAFAGSANAAGHYVGSLVVTMTHTDGVHMVLTQPFEFVDDDGTLWPVPKGAMTDGASIPKVFWSVIGGPFEGLYREAAVIHDYYCDRRTRKWEDVDRVFYDAMLVSGVDPIKAKVMYAAVRWGGPRWDDQAINNNIIPPPEIPEHRLTKIGAAFSVQSGVEPWLSAPLHASAQDISVFAFNTAVDANTSAVNLIVDKINKSNPDLDAIDKMIDKELSEEPTRFNTIFRNTMIAYGGIPGEPSTAALRNPPDLTRGIVPSSPGNVVDTVAGQNPGRLLCSLIFC
jgi:hypothetical protein